MPMKVLLRDRERETDMYTQTERNEILRNEQIDVLIELSMFGSKVKLLLLNFKNITCYQTKQKRYFCTL